MCKRQQIPPVKLIKTIHITDKLLPKKLVEIGGSDATTPPPFNEESANFIRKKNSPESARNGVCVYNKVKNGPKMPQDRQKGLIIYVIYIVELDNPFPALSTEKMLPKKRGIGWYHAIALPP